MKTEKSFFNRELSWIEFNARVLSEACSKDVPLFERLQFFSIVGTNFDEFFMIRVARLKRQLLSQPDWCDISGLTTRQTLKLISKRVHEVVKIQYDNLINKTLPELAEKGIEYIPPKKYTMKQFHYVENLFNEEIFPLLTPLRTDNARMFPHITNLKLHAAFLLEPISNNVTTPLFQSKKGDSTVAIVQVPTSINRIVWLPSDDEKKKFTVLDDVIECFGTLLFPGYNVKETLLFKVTRDADFSVDEERQDDIIHAMEKVLVRRQSSIPVRIVCNNTSKLLKDYIVRNLNLSQQDVYQVPVFVDLSQFAEFNALEDYSNLKNHHWKNFWPSSIPEDKSVWDFLKRTDALIHVPYESYEPVIRFIDTAAEDGNVLAIKMTLYRTSGNSPIVHSLEHAARKGKQVTVFVELKARFDEKRNISWANELEQAGVIVVYGIAKIKVHAKVLMVVRKEEKGIQRYVHLSTGNYNDKTARVYSDLSLFTSNNEIANDATFFFNMISGYSVIQTLKRLIMAPVNLKQQLLAMIERETRNSSKERPGLIVAKMNSLAHIEIIQALYRANNAGVKILLNVRGICMLVPGIPGQSENITVVSVIDRYLEHSRITYFQNGGDEEIYLASADWMPRNLERRVELMFPVLQKDLFMQIKENLMLYFKDNCKSHYLQCDGTWLKKSPLTKESRFRVQECLYEKYKKNNERKDSELPHEFQVFRNN